MLFDERNEGEYRIYAGALEAPQGDGYLAAVVINRLRGVKEPPREAYRDTAMAAGYRWASARDALSYALAKGLEMIRTERQRLTC